MMMSLDKDAVLTSSDDNSQKGIICWEEETDNNNTDLIFDDDHDDHDLSSTACDSSCSDTTLSSHQKNDAQETTGSHNNQKHPEDIGQNDSNDEEASFPSSRSNSNNTNKQVRFGTAKFDFFRMSLSDNPSAHRGVPVGMSRDKLGSAEFCAVELDDSNHQREDSNKRGGACRKLSLEQRMSIAKTNHTYREIREVHQQVNETKRNRMESRNDKDVSLLLPQMKDHESSSSQQNEESSFPIRQSSSERGQQLPTTKTRKNPMRSLFGRRNRSNSNHNKNDKRPRLQSRIESSSTCSTTEDCSSSSSERSNRKTSLRFLWHRSSSSNSTSMPRKSSSSSPEEDSSR